MPIYKCIFYILSTLRRGFRRAIALGNFAGARRRHAHTPFRAPTPPPFQGGGAETDSRVRPPWPRTGGGLTG